MLEIKNLHIEIDDFKLHSINLEVKKGEYYALLGASGAGKSVLLETIAGMVKASQGDIILDKINITHKKIQDRNVGIVFQDFAIFPNMTVLENISFPMHCKKQSKKVIKKKVEEISDLVNISHILDRIPETLSGGELQRVALGRILALDPEILLLDEPLSSLDIQLKHEMQALLRKINRTGQTIIHVTHDYREAIALAGKISVINNGTIEQSGTPKEIFHNPKSKFIANFTGIKNFYNAKLLKSNVLLLENKVKITLPKGNYANSGFATFRTSDVIISLNKLDSSICNQIIGKVTDIIPLEEGVELVIDAGIKIASSITLNSIENLKLKIGSEIWVGLKATAIKYLLKITD